MQFEFDEELALVRVRGAGRVTVTDIARRESGLLTESWYSHALPRLIDLRDVDDLPRYAEIARYASTASEPPPAGQASRRAVLVRTDLQYGLANMVIAHIDRPGLRYEIFRDEAAALAWLTGGERPEGG
jgi:hypothetical protein